MTHPAGIDPAAKLWWGPEVENDRRGLLTAFVAGRLDGSEIARVERDAQHVFITETFLDLDWVQRFLAPHLRPGVPMTVARFADPRTVQAFLAHDLAERARLVVRVHAPWANLLRARDEVSVGVPYRMHTFRMKDGIRVIPSHYASDTP